MIKHKASISAVALAVGQVDRFLTCSSPAGEEPVIRLSHLSQHRLLSAAVRQELLAGFLVGMTSLRDVIHNLKIDFRTTV